MFSKTIIQLIRDSDLVFFVKYAYNYVSPKGHREWILFMIYCPVTYFMYKGWLK